jgi:hypothetical protein
MSQRDKNELLGYVAINKSSGLIVDMLARTKEDLQEVLQSVVHCLHDTKPRTASYRARKNQRDADSIHPGCY